MNNKITNAMALEVAISAVKAQGNAEVVEKLEKMLVQTNKKNSADKKPTATQTQNIELKDSILEFMQADTKYTITDLLTACPALEGLTNQKVNALMKQLKDAKQVERIEEKRKAYFFKVVEA